MRPHMHAPMPLAPGQHAARGARPATQHVRAGGAALTISPMRAGLDSATTFTVTKWLRVVTHAMRLTTVVSLLQPAPEVFALFDDVLLLTDGCVQLLSLTLGYPLCHVAVRLCGSVLGSSGQPQVWVFGLALCCSVVVGTPYAGE